MSFRSELQKATNKACNAFTSARYRLQIRRHRNRHKGQACVIVGNGPSLNRMDLSFLHQVPTFATNKIYLMFDRFAFTPSYWVCVNPFVVEQSAEHLDKLKCPKFVDSNSRQRVRGRPDVTLLKSRLVRGLAGPYFSRRAEFGVFPGWTVTYVCMQLAYHMGFSKVYLIGVDHNYVTGGQPNEAVVSDGPDQSHFDPNYFGAGTQWHLPDLQGSEASYRLAKFVFERSGRQILDATVDGKLNVFPKVDYHEIGQETVRMAR